MSAHPVIAGVGSARPPRLSQQELWDECLAGRVAPGQRRKASLLWRAAGVTTRHAVVDPRRVDVRCWGTEARMRRYLAEALPLASAAVGAALGDAGLTAADVSLLAVVSCTGYATPGLDLLVARDLGMNPALQRLAVGHMGCYAALPGLGAVGDAAAARGLVGVLACVELPSLHAQHDVDDAEQIVVHALFGDAAAAVVVVPGETTPAARVPGSARGLALVDLVARTDLEHLDAMSWEITDHGFRMGLSAKVPNVLADHVGPLVGDLLAAHGLSVADVAGWVVHPGGPAILDVCANRLGLSTVDLAPSRLTLAEDGNCSSATVLLAAERLLDKVDLSDGDPVVMLAFGPGLTLYGALLRACPIPAATGRPVTR